ncbi:hypothetical protein [Streptomyces sp.]|uniref:hypothetical protein n=1 Tax=Streptomyces sp. TaxID=1931 RepID=UPI002F95A76B
MKRTKQQQPVGYTVTFTPQQQQQPPKRRAWPVRAGRWLHRNRLWLIPLSVPPGLSVMAQKAHTGSWWWWFIPAVLLVSSAIVMGAPDRWDRVSEVRFARATAVGIASWLIAGTLWGAWNAFMTYTLGGLWTLWTGIWWWHKRPRKQDKALAEWDLQWQMIIHRMRPKPLTNSHVIDVDLSDENVDALLVQLDRGRQDIGDLRAAGNSILSAWECPEETTFRVSKHGGGNRNLAWFRIQHANPLAERREWDEDLAPRSFLDEFVVGFTPEGALIKTLMRKAHWFIIGMTQWGKSSWLGQLMAQLGACDDTIIWFIDLKGGGTVAPWRRIVDWEATTQDEAEAMLSAAVRIIKARNAVTDDHEPSPEDPAIIIVVDEANEAWGQGTGTSRLVSLGVSVASLGAGMSVHLVAATQIGGLSSMGDERIRGNMGKSMAFRPEKDEHAQYALQDWAKLNASRLDEPGMFYFKDNEKDSVLGRGFWLSRPQRARLARMYADRRPVLPEALALHAGEAYLTRHDRKAAARPSSPTVKEPTVSSPQEMAAAIEAELPAFVSVADMRALDEARADEGLPPLSAERAHQNSQDRFVEELLRGPRSPKELAAASGMSVSWVRHILPRLADYGAVKQEGPRQPYEAVPGMDLHEALEEIRSDRRKLEAQAREMVGS